MTAAALQVSDLTVTYPNGHRALRGVSFTVPEGGSVGVVGISGCGKSTLAKAILGLLPAGSIVQGDVRVGEHDVLRASAQAMRAWRGQLIGFVGQDPFSAFDPLRRVRHHVNEPWLARRLSPPTELVDDGLARFGIRSERAVQRPHQWSGGMLQRATTLAATALHPLLTIADEPTSALDHELAATSLTMLRESCRSLLLISHDLDAVVGHTDETVILHEGAVVETGPSARLFAEAVHPVTRSLADHARQPPLHREPVTADVVSELRSVTRSYPIGGRRTRVLDGVDIAIRRGEVVGIIGPSGSGKSTLLRLLAGLERPDSGEALAEGATMWRRRMRLPRRGWVMPVFQDPVSSLDSRWPLWRSLVEPLRLDGTILSGDAARERARAVLDSAGMHDVEVDRRPGALSVGQCQRVAILRACVGHPGLITADEPTASLDVASATTVGALLRRAADDGAAVVAVSHDERRLRTYADRVLRLDAGRIQRVTEVSA